tara:strand:- start:3383 stop:5545 length:2163 start_codon:yes stop_codon:yes gene_type:complete
MVSNGVNLSTPLEGLFRINVKQKRALERMKLLTVRDLLYHFPARYESSTDVKQIKDLVKGDQAIVYGTLKSLKTKKAFLTKVPMAEGSLVDDTGTLKLTWFNQPFIAKTFKEGVLVKIVGKVSEGKYGKSISNPEISYSDESPFQGNSLFKEGTSSFFLPIYPETRGITSRWFFHAISKILSDESLALKDDPIPEDILKKYNLPTQKTALVWIHTPQKHSHIEASKKRFSFEEIFFIQLKRLSIKKEYEKNPAFKIPADKEVLTRFLDKLGFPLTGAQSKSLKQILGDLKKDSPMSRLLEGDVGSGKTAVSAAAAYAVTHTHPDGKDFGHLQVAYMVPTEILARQHFESFIAYFKNSPINVGLITGSECRKFPSKIDPEGHTHISRAQLLKWVENGEIPILVGTHALIQDKVKFKHLALVIIDEQHRFGVMQRGKLAKKGDKEVPHLLSMTATPIPRTLALTLYGDLDLSVVDELPKGRKPIITKIVAPVDRKATYEKIKEELKEGRQVYVICPRIDEPDPDKETALRVKSAKEEAKRLQKEIFPEYNVGLVHSKLKPKDKEEVMDEFTKGEVDILTATSVIEVGVNVPNATTIIIEGAERFGLAQLHQLRGRVLRSNHQAYCYLFSDSKNEKSHERLRALTEAKNGFELAELDLSLRGEGTLSGAKQWGLGDMGMEAIKNIKMVEAARNEAQTLIESGDLGRYPAIKKHIEERHDVHFE